MTFHVTPGDYLIELSFRRPIIPAVLEAGLERLGATEIVLDQSLVVRSTEPENLSEWSEPAEGPHRYRAVVRFAEPLTLVGSENVRWSFVHRLQLDPFAPIDGKLQFAYHLQPGETYEVRFDARRSYQDKLIVRKKAFDLLARMGWDIHKLSCLARDMRLPGSSFSVGLWVGLVTWKRCRSVIHEEDPLFFEDIKVLGFSHDGGLHNPHTPVGEKDLSGGDPRTPQRPERKEA